MDPDEKRFREQELRLERWKFLLSALVPLVLLMLTGVVNNALKEREGALDREKQVLAEKQKIYQDMGLKLNIIFVYVSDVGDFRSYNPVQIVEFKRQVDRQFCSYLPYWSENTEMRYAAFTEGAFKTYEWPEAKIRSFKAEKVAGSKSGWDGNWNAYFTEERVQRLDILYYDLVRSILEDTVTPGTREIDHEKSIVCRPKTHSSAGSHPRR